MERGLDECTLTCGQWNVMGNATEKGLFVLIPVCIIYILYNELVVIYILIIKKIKMGKHYSQQEMQMVNKQMKKCSSLLIIKKGSKFCLSDRQKYLRIQDW